MILRSLPGHGDSIFLTFDDGPDPIGTAAVLDVLRDRQVPATFFLIGNKIRHHIDLIERIKREGHAIGNHSWDHRYRNFFRGSSFLKTWITRTQDEFGSFGILESVGFRPPAGVLTPHLLKAADELNIPIILWNERFYDAVIPWTIKRAKKSASRISGGSIVLLHDRQAAHRISEFRSVLETYIDEVRSRGFRFSALK